MHIYSDYPPTTFMHVFSVFIIRLRQKTSVPNQYCSLSMYAGQIKYFPSTSNTMRQHVLNAILLRFLCAPNVFQKGHRSVGKCIGEIFIKVDFLQSYTYLMSGESLWCAFIGEYDYILVDAFSPHAGVRISRLGAYTRGITT